MDNFEIDQPAACGHADEIAAGRSADYDGDDDFRQSILVAFNAIRERMAQGGPGWDPK
jgi:hypothetical protein